MRDVSDNVSVQRSSASPSVSGAVCSDVPRCRSVRRVSPNPLSAPLVCWRLHVACRPIQRRLPHVRAQVALVCRSPAQSSRLLHEFHGDVSGASSPVTGVHAVPDVLTVVSRRRVRLLLSSLLRLRRRRRKLIQGLFPLFRLIAYCYTLNVYDFTVYSPVFAGTH